MIYKLTLSCGDKSFVGLIRLLNNRAITKGVLRYLKEVTLMQEELLLLWQVVLKEVVLILGNITSRKEGKENPIKRLLLLHLLF